MLALVSPESPEARRAARARLAVILLSTRIKIRTRHPTGWRYRADGPPLALHTNRAGRASPFSAQGAGRQGVISQTTGRLRSASHQAPPVVRCLFRGIIPQSGAGGVASRGKQRRQSGIRSIGPIGETLGEPGWVGGPKKVRYISGTTQGRRRGRRLVSRITPHV